MKILLDTNIIIHREANTVIDEDIGILFKWLDNLHYKKYIHPVTIGEISKYKNLKILKSLNIKLGNYNILKTESPLSSSVKKVSKKLDQNENDVNDTKLLNELLNSRVDILITEDRKIIYKAELLGIADKVFTIDSFLGKVNTENPELIDYKVLAVKKELFGNVDLRDGFFDSFRRDYTDFDKWFNKKSDETAYVYKSGENIMAFLYLKTEGVDENYSDISPPFTKKKRTKIGTFKVALNGYKLGERFLKIIFDNALRFKVEDIYVTTFDKSVGQKRLINLLEDYGFIKHGSKKSTSGEESVYVRNFSKRACLDRSKVTYPYISKKSNIFIVPIYPKYHTNLFPDSILKTESSEEFEKNESFRNAISKVYISRSIKRNLQSGDIIVFYRTGGYYEGVITTIGVVENVITNITDETHLIRLCRKRSVFSDKELLEHWNYNKFNRPFVVNFLYVYSFPKRINMKRLIEINIIQDVKSAPRGFTKISLKNFNDIIKETHTDASIIVD